MHDQIRPLTANLRKKKAELVLNKGLTAAGMTIADLPEVKCRLNGKEGLCWKYVMGNCLLGKKCKFVHPPAKQLPASLITKALPTLTKLAKGFEKCLSQGEEGGGQQDTQVQWS